MVAIALHDVSKHFSGMAALDRLNFDIRTGELVTLLGASGSGKTTCLRLVAGFTSPDAGRILFDGRDVTRVPVYDRNIGMMFQQYALFPHLTVAENVAFGLRVRRVGRSERDARVREALQLVRLEALAGRYPAQLSGGQKQRVALARAVVIRPDVLLLDEPLGALDLKLREELQAEIRRVQQALGVTTIFVTHDQHEALGLSDRVALMHEGRIVQAGPPDELYARPDTLYAATFIGRSTRLPVGLPADGVGEPTGGVTVAGADGRFVLSGPGAPKASVLRRDGSYVLMIRPENARISDDGPNVLQVTVERSTYSGEAWLVEGRSAASAQVLVRTATPPPQPGSRIPVSFAPDAARLLPA